MAQCVPKTDRSRWTIGFARAFRKWNSPSSRTRRQRRSWLSSERSSAGNPMSSSCAQAYRTAALRASFETARRELWLGARESIDTEKVNGGVRFREPMKP